MKSTLVQFMEFRSSTVWADIRSILLERLSVVRDELEVVSTKVLDEQLLVDLVNKGRAEELRFVSDIVDYIIDKWDELKEGE